MKRSMKVHPSSIYPTTIGTSTAVSNHTWGMSASTVDRSLLGGCSLNPAMDNTLDQICPTRSETNNNIYSDTQEIISHERPNAQTLSTEQSRQQHVTLDIKKGNRESILAKSAGRSQDNNTSDCVNDPLAILSKKVWHTKQGRITAQGSRSMNNKKQRYQRDHGTSQMEREISRDEQSLDVLQKVIYQQQGIINRAQEQLDDDDDEDDYAIEQCRIKKEKQEEECYGAEVEDDNIQDHNEPPGSLQLNRISTARGGGERALPSALTATSSLYQQTQSRILTSLSCNPNKQIKIPPSPVSSLFTQIMPLDDQELVQQQQKQLSKRNIDIQSNPLGNHQQPETHLSQQQQQQSQQDEDKQLCRNEKGQNTENSKYKNKILSSSPQNNDNNDITINQQQQDNLLVNASSLPTSVCRICMEGACTAESGELIHPCHCSGSMEAIHSECLKTWILTQSIEIPTAQCEVCHTTFIQHITFAPAFLLRNALSEGKRNCQISIIFFCIFLSASAAFAFLLFKSLNTSSTTADTAFLDDETNRISLLCVCAAIMVVLLVIVLITFREACWITAIKTWEICNINHENNPSNNNHNNNNNIIDNNKLNNNNNNNNNNALDNMIDDGRGNFVGHDNNFNQNDLSNANNRHNQSNNYNQQHSIFETIQHQQSIKQHTKNILRQSMSSPTIIVPVKLDQTEKKFQLQDKNNNDNNQNIIKQDYHNRQKPFRSAAISRNTSKSNISHGQSATSSQKQLNKPIKNVLYNKCLFVQNKHRSGACTPARLPEY